MANETLLIPYGVERWSADYLAPGGAGGAPACLVPHVIIDPARRAPLRLYDGPYDFIEAPPLQDLADPAAQLDYLRAYVDRHCGLWAKFQKLFIDRYFAFVSAEVEAGRRDLEGRAAAFGGLYNYRDWLFSALRPLPQAHLCLDVGAGRPLVRVDFAFWTGAAVLAVDLVGTETAGPAQEARAARLKAAGITRVKLPQAALHAGTLADHLPPPLVRFWQDDPVPSGPFIPATLATTELAGT